MFIFALWFTLVVNAQQVGFIVKGEEGTFHDIQLNLHPPTPIEATLTRPQKHNLVFKSKRPLSQVSFISLTNLWRTVKPYDDEKLLFNFMGDDLYSQEDCAQDQNRCWIPELYSPVYAVRSDDGFFTFSVDWSYETGSSCADYSRTNVINLLTPLWPNGIIPLYKDETIELNDNYSVSFGALLSRYPNYYGCKVESLSLKLSNNYSSAEKKLDSQENEQTITFSVLSSDLPTDGSYFFRILFKDDSVFDSISSDFNTCEGNQPSTFAPIVSKQTYSVGDVVHFCVTTPQSFNECSNPLISDSFSLVVTYTHLDDNNQPINSFPEQIASEIFTSISKTYCEDFRIPQDMVGRTQITPFLSNRDNIFREGETITFEVCGKPRALSIISPQNGSHMQPITNIRFTVAEYSPFEQGYSCTDANAARSVQLLMDSEKDLENETEKQPKTLRGTFKPLFSNSLLLTDTLEYGTKYYFRIVTSSSPNDVVSSSVSSFTTDQERCGGDLCYNGECIEEYDSYYTCSCFSGWEGKQCQSEVKGIKKHVLVIVVVCVAIAFIALTIFLIIRSRKKKRIRLKDENEGNFELNIREN